jgi:hypothetical protein
MNLHLVLYIAAFILAVIAAAGVSSRINLLAASFACYVLTFII